MLTCKQVIAVTVLLVGGLISGCSYTANKLDSSASVSPAETMSQTQQDASPADDVQNGKERTLVMMFHALIKMDRQSGLTITNQQAKAMLPLVRKSMEEGSLNESTNMQVMNVLTAEQKSFLDEQSKQAKTQAARRDGHPANEISPEEREKRIAEFTRRRNLDQPQETGKTDGGSRDSLPPSDSKSGGKSVEKQLIELLESKRP
ncbi:hypothetical protein [Paenibacillus sp. SI8]|uniref:hypothetical protein n=1 Tax=unclassified Paenibacillus TaxID=185978 RepID=UPI003466A6AD